MLVFALVLSLTTEQWLEDFRFILNEMAVHYANLDSAIADRKVDLVGLRRRAQERISAAKTDDEARQAIDQFLAAFGDGHVDVTWPKAAAAQPEPQSVCERLGYHAREPRGVNFSLLPEFQQMDDTDFPGGILTLSNGTKAGVVRIALFSGQSHPELCPVALTNLKIANDAPCDDNCEHAIELEVENLVTDRLAARVRALTSAGAKALVIDITGNGGGTNWVEPAARTLTPVPLRSPRLGFIKHPHWVKDFRERLDDLKSATGDPAVLANARDTLQRGLTLASETCDRSGVWNEPPQMPKCSLLVNDLLFTSGVLPYAKPGSTSPILFLPAQYRYTEGVNRLPLVVLVDQGTASASEYFAAMLQDNTAATIIGTPTFGAGCGHTNGGIWATLPNSKGKLSLPDCARFRANRTNEIVGITPDLLVPWRRFDSPYQTAAKAKRAIEELVRKGGLEPPRL